MRITFTKLFPALVASATLLAPACHKDEAPVARDRSIADTGAAAREARRANEDLRGARGDMAKQAAQKAGDVGKNVGKVGSADATFLARRDQVVAQARTSLAAMDQKIAELESYRSAGHVKDAAKADGALGTLREQRKLSAAALEDLAIADAGNWDTRRVSVEKAFSDLDKDYADARDQLDVKASTQR